VTRPISLFARAALVVAVGLTGGCAVKRGIANVSAVQKPTELQTLADLQPPLDVPRPVDQPPGSPPMDALAAYARGRDALLRDQKAVAIKQLTTAAELDPASAVVWRDLGYAQLGMDDAKAAAAFRQAVSFDPADADSRLQLARLLLASKKPPEALTQLRLARLSPGYTSDKGLAAVVDLLLGQILEQGRFRAAALECYEHVLAIVDERAFSLRGRPELADVLTRPGILVLRTADLATQNGRFTRAIELYKRLQQQEPQSAAGLELRLARAELAAGDSAGATARAFAFVAESKASPLALAAFADLFDASGGPRAALAALDKFEARRESGGAADDDRRFLLRSYLLLEAGDPTAAVDAVDRVRDITVPSVRQTVHAYRAAGRHEQLLHRLITLTAADAAKWSTVERGWQMLTHLAQPRPLTAERLLALKVETRLGSARNYVAAKVYLSQGRQKTAKDLSASIALADANRFDAAAADASPAPQLADVDEVSSSTEMATLFDAYRDDPELLMATVAETLRAGQKRLAFDALAAVQTQRPDAASVAGAYAQVLAADNQRSAAGQALDKAVGRVASAPELYYLASQYSLIGDDKAAERVLRKAYGYDPNAASVCNDLGYLLTDQGRELPFAEALLTRAATLEPDNAAYLDSLGWLLYKRGKFDEAAKRLEEAVAAAVPVDPVVLDHAGDAHYQAKQPERSAERWQQAVDAIKARGTQDPQLRLRIEQKLRQLQQKTPVVVAPVVQAD
jgi:Tfp pilus assembly protein PilF